MVIKETIISFFDRLNKPIFPFTNLVPMLYTNCKFSPNFEIVPFLRLYFIVDLSKIASLVQIFEVILYRARTISATKCTPKDNTRTI